MFQESEDGTEYEDTNSDIDNKTDKAEQSSVDGIGANDHNSQEAHKGTQQPSSFTNSLTSALETAKKLSHDNAHVLENICRTEKPNAKSSSSSSRLSSDSPLKSRSAQESATVTANCFNPTTHDKTRDSDQISSNDDEAKEEEDLTEGDSFSGWVPPSGKSLSSPLCSQLNFVVFIAKWFWTKYDKTFLITIKNIESENVV